MDLQLLQDSSLPSKSPLPRFSAKIKDSIRKSPKSVPQDWINAFKPVPDLDIAALEGTWMPPPPADQTNSQTPPSPASDLPQDQPSPNNSNGNNTNNNTNNTVNNNTSTRSKSSMSSGSNTLTCPIELDETVFESTRFFKHESPILSSVIDDPTQIMQIQKTKKNSDK
ncbi:hypothetical protein BGX34_011401 [Mortierella sp. NVP85]|nr:hypothetical protein BGX34_011401 [Mortierella sp. NVP85]